MQNALDGGVHESGLVGEFLHHQFLGDCRKRSGHLRFYSLNHFQGGGHAAFHDGEQYPSCAIVAHYVGLGLRAIANLSDFFQTDYSPAHRAHGHLVELF